VVPVAQFQGFRQEVGEPGDFALVSAFRTEDARPPDRSLDLGFLGTYCNAVIRSNSVGTLLNP